MWENKLSRLRDHVHALVSAQGPSGCTDQHKQGNWSRGCTLIDHPKLLMWGNGVECPWGVAGAVCLLGVARLCRVGVGLGA